MGKKGCEALNNTAAAVANKSLARAGNDLAGMEKVVADCSQPFVMLIYDIPSRLSSECPNPSRLLWRHGFRLNLSCWVLPLREMDALPLVDLMALWAEHGVRVHCIEYAESQRDKIKAIAVEKLEEELRRQHTSLIVNLSSADEWLKKALEAADGEKGLAKAGATYKGRMRLVFREASNMLDAAILCAQTYDDTGMTSDLVNGLRQAIAAKKAAFEAHAEALYSA
jgi:hypothetical protein